MSQTGPAIHLAFRFHGNFYHSYRGDTPDELGFGKDIRIIRHVIQTLDELNTRGIPVCGTWDFENYFSLQEIMPAHCPDIIEALQRRAHGRVERDVGAGDIVPGRLEEAGEGAHAGAGDGDEVDVHGGRGA